MKKSNPPLPNIFWEIPCPILTWPLKTVQALIFSRRAISCREGMSSEDSGASLFLRSIFLQVEPTITSIRRRVLDGFHAQVSQPYLCLRKSKMPKGIFQDVQPIMERQCIFLGTTSLPCMVKPQNYISSQPPIGRG